MNATVLRSPWFFPHPRQWIILGRLGRGDLRVMTFLLCTALIVIFTAGMACAHDETVQEANRLWWDGNYEQAAALYEAALRGSAGGAAARVQLAALYRSTGDYSVAIEQYHTLLAENDVLGEMDVVNQLYIPLGESCFYINRLEEAEETFRLALAQESRNHAALFGLGRVLFEKGDLEQAARAFQDAAAARPEFQGNYIYLARIAERLGDTWMSLSLYQKALQIDSQQAELLLPLGRMYENMGSWEDAYRQYHRLRNIDGSNPLVLAKLDEIRPRLTVPEEEVVPARSLETFKTVRRLVGPERIPVLRIGLNTTAGGKIVVMKNLSFIANGGFDILASGSILFTGQPHIEYEVIQRSGGVFIQQTGSESLQELPDRFVIQVTRLSASGAEPECIIIKKIEYARGYAWAGIEDRQYRGRIEVRADSDGFRLINEVNLEEYLYSVVPSEMSISFPEEALKAQAVIARSYALYRQRFDRPHRSDGFDLCDSQHCQVYRGASNEWEQTTRSVNETRGEILLFNGNPASPLFHANCGGHTQSSGDLKGWGDVAYLTGVLDAPPGLVFPTSPAGLEHWVKIVPPVYCSAPRFNSGPEFRWFRLIPANVLQEKLNRYRPIGEIEKIAVLRRNPAGYVHSVEIRGAEGTFLIEKEHEIRRLLGFGPLRSNLFWLETRYAPNGLPAEFLLYGGGWGHGVGLCQDGAGGMAEKGLAYDDILSHYYSGTELMKLDY